ncbi:TetR/AcrR family transcriptional regulator [Actinophytocola oryzae]|uniref:TetR family transcriptional regulator n=1 Tax=Actinophytocola oryzae TaxID=502181 RepID=A0A4V3FV01_9PSEU|nr:helix-turn-helix domain-containing protein [Actinophytocola oryzae]TDV57191.1 TetR family transcriptional regulator [Actinophytocola oryzae]
MANPRPLRADAARNREKLLAAATQLFGERGLDVPLEHIARRAEVSIGTLYAHFPTRDTFFEAIFPERLTELATLGERALADPDPWHGFVGYLEGVFALHARDRGLNEVLVRDLPNARGVVESCHTGAGHAAELVRRARESGRLRADYTTGDVATLTRAMAQVIRDSLDTDPTEWRRFLAIYLAGLQSTST